MKIAFLASYNSIHSIRWVNAIAKKGNQVYLISCHRSSLKLEAGVQLITLLYPAPLGYYLNIFALKKILNQIKPELLHVHYASGYGTLGRLSGYKPALLSVWGSDVYEFPYKSAINRRILEKNINAYPYLASTSKAMAKHVKQFLHKQQKIYITPFGVDINQFTPGEKTVDEIVVGTIKTLKPIYGIDILIRAFARVFSYF